LTLHRGQEVQHPIFWNILETCAPTTIPCIQWTKQLVCINWKKVNRVQQRREAVRFTELKTFAKKFLMIHGRYQKKKTKIECPSQWSFHFLKCPTDSGEKSMLWKELSNYTRKMGAGLYAVMLQTEQQLTLFTKM
jgi:hypothetical protein